MAVSTEITNLFSQRKALGCRLTHCKKLPISLLNIQYSLTQRYRERVLAYRFLM